MLEEWQNIVPPSASGACNVRLADSSHPLDFRIGRDHRSRFIFQLDADCENAEEIELPKIAAFACELDVVADGRSRLSLVLNNAADFRNFALMCSSLIDRKRHV